MQGVGAKVLTKPAVKGREGVRRCQTFFKQQAHRIAFVAHARLQPDKDIAKSLAQHKQSAAVAV
jgi:hypothetical protein